MPELVFIQHFQDVHHIAKYVLPNPIMHCAISKLFCVSHILSFTEHIFVDSTKHYKFPKIEAKALQSCLPMEVNDTQSIVKPHNLAIRYFFSIVSSCSQAH